MSRKYAFATFHAGAILAAGRALATPTLTTLATFTGANGFEPRGTLCADASGNLYGTTVGGGSTGGGTAFELNVGSQTISTLAHFPNVNFSPATDPENGLTADTAGNLFGTVPDDTQGDGTGLIYKLAAGSHAFSVVYSFPFGGRLSGTPLVDSRDDLYGASETGGNHNDGWIYEWNASSNAISTVASFSQSNGASPSGNLVMDRSGNLYGTTSAGGTTNYGTVFQINTSTGSINTLAKFSGTNGDQPSSGLIADASGNLYGTTLFGGIGFSIASASGYGTIFEITAGSHQLITLGEFNRSNGSVPTSLLLDAAGDLFGATTDGGTHNDGTVFELAAGTNTITTLYSFSGPDGSYPFNGAGLIADAQGNLYGTTQAGGSSGDGTIFELQLPEPLALPMLLGCVVSFTGRRRRAAGYKN